MRAIPKLSTALSWLVPLTMLIVLAACVPPQAELDTAATGSAAETSAAQTAGAPTPTPKPTDTQIPTSTPTPEPPTLVPKSPPEKILFIGNSLTGLWNENHTENMAASAKPSLAIEADSALLMGSNLEDIWKESDARERIANGNYDVVVLQETLQYTNEDTFHEYARMFDAEIKETGAETVLFMAWYFEGELFGEMPSIEEITQAHHEIAAELGIEVIPVGLAWQRAMEERPDLELTYDGEHAGIYGQYLAINVVYATLFGESPVDLAYLPEEFEEITEEEAEFLQRIALETVLEYQMK